MTAHRWTNGLVAAGLVVAACSLAACSSASDNQVLPAPSITEAATRNTTATTTTAGSTTTTTVTTTTAGEPADPTLDTTAQPVVRTGADVLVSSEFAALDGLRVGLITNQVSVVDGRHLIDWLAAAPNVDLVKIFGAEHGVRGDADAGELLDDGVDPTTGIPIFSLYGSVRQPTPEMLDGLDALVFDLQDVGTRYYTYTATMGLAMQTAAEVGVRFVVLDRPNPLGGELVEGFLRTDDQVSFISQYPVPAVHGLTSGELAIMIRDEQWLAGVERVDLEVVELDRWQRKYTWSETGLSWVPPSPGLQTAASAATYPCTVLFEATTLSYGAGSDWAFQAVAAPWLDGEALATDMNRRNLAGVRFEPVSFTPRLIPNISFDPRWLDVEVHGVRLVVTDPAVFEPTAVGVHLLEATQSMGMVVGEEVIDRPTVLDRLAGTTTLRRSLETGVAADQIVGAWEGETEAFAERSQPYRLYD